MAASGDRAATTWEYFVFCTVICLMVNWASTCANHSSGSEGQNGGILIITEFVVMVTFEVEVEGGELSAVEGVSTIAKSFPLSLNASFLTQNKLSYNVLFVCSLQTLFELALLGFHRSNCFLTIYLARKGL